MVVIYISRAEAVKTFLHRLDENVLKKGILVNVKVAYFTQDENSTQQSENQLKNYLRDFQNKYKYLKFQFIEAEGQFSRGRGECQRAKFEIFEQKILELTKFWCGIFFERK